MATIEELEKHTNDFFKLHWKETETPTWRVWNFVGMMQEKQANSQGVYAFIKNDRVIYVGSGTAQRAGNAIGAGLGKRVMTYLRPAPKDRQSGKIYRPAINWLIQEDPTGVMTLGFPERFGYLALALEAYLISNLGTSLRNRNRPGHDTRRKR